MANDGRGEDVVQRTPFQFTLRTLMLVTLVVALFCSAATTFEGMRLFLAVAVIAWAVIGAIYWKSQAAFVVVFAHACGAVSGGVMLAVSAWRNSIWVYAWEVLVGIGLVAGILASVHLACGHRLLVRTIRRLHS